MGDQGTPLTRVDFRIVKGTSLRPYEARSRRHPLGVAYQDGTNVDAIGLTRSRSSESSRGLIYLNITLTHEDA